MLGITNLKPGIHFLLDNEPYEVLEAQHSKYAQRRPVMQAKIRSLISGKVLQRNFLQNETFQEAELEKFQVKYLYNHRNQYWFNSIKNSSERFSLTIEQLGEEARFLRQNLEVEAVQFGGKIINIELPVKVDYKVTEAPPGVRGDTAQGGTKAIILENGLIIQAPLFIENGDVVRVNTATSEYVERVKKS